MVRNKANLLLVIAPGTSPIPLPDNKQIIYLTELTRLFPAIHEMQPGGLILDYDYLGDQTEKILRRIVFNSFYNKIKIYCYKTKPNTKVDALLKVLGVQQFIYAQDTMPKQKHNTFKTLGEILKGSINGKLADAGY